MLNAVIPFADGRIRISAASGPPIPWRGIAMFPPVRVHVGADAELHGWPVATANRRMRRPLLSGGLRNSGFGACDDRG